MQYNAFQFRDPVTTKHSVLQPFTRPLRACPAMNLSPVDLLLAWPDARSPGLLVLLASVGASALICLTQGWHGAFSLDRCPGIQTAHHRAAPRIGGLALGLALLVAWACLEGPARHALAALMRVSVPVVFLGLLEDLTGRVRPFWRFWGAAVSATLAMAHFQYSLIDTSLWSWDPALQWVLPGMLFTVFAVSGVTHAFNIIDGSHGLASFGVLFVLLGLGCMAQAQGDELLLHLIVLLALAVLGFLPFNWPGGRLFLGDGGAYFLGFAVAWLAVMLGARHPQLSVFALLLTCFHPVMEVLFSMWRRTRHRVPLGQPDRLHFHSLLRRRIVAPALPPRYKTLANPLSGLLCALMSLLANLLAMHTATDHGASILALLAMVLLYLTVYARMVRFHWCQPWVLFVPRRRWEVAHGPH